MLKKKHVTLQCFKKGDRFIKMLACFQLHTYYGINGTKALPSSGSRWTEAVKRSVRLYWEQEVGAAQRKAALTGAGNFATGSCGILSGTTHVAALSKQGRTVMDQPPGIRAGKVLMWD